jgi:hypothetical protein
VGVDCKFLNFGVNIAKSLKFHGLKVNFSLNNMRLSRVTAKKVTGIMDAIQLITLLIDNQSLNFSNMNNN